jgi:TonB family protein
VTSPSGGLALGIGSGGGEETFPFTYYLNRVLALIESNWFRPPAPADTHCRVRCVIDRSGRLVEAGLEQESASAAFDRAALRAVYAAAPLPPLPQGFGGTTLTIHLEFGE